MAVYLLDTNIFIQAKNSYCAFDLCPTFWSWLLEQNNQGKISSINEVLDELSEWDDELSSWAKEQDEGFFLKPDGEVAQALIAVSDWAERKMSEGMKGVPRFLKGKIPFLLLMPLRSMAWS